MARKSKPVFDEKGNPVKPLSWGEAGVALRVAKQTKEERSAAARKAAAARWAGHKPKGGKP